MRRSRPCVDKTPPIWAEGRAWCRTFFWAWRLLGNGHGDDRKPVVLVEITGRRFAATQKFFDPTDGLLRHVLGKGAGSGARLKNSGDRVMIEGAKGVRMAQGLVDVVTGKALPKQQNLARMVTAVTAALALQARKEVGRGLAQIVEGGA